MLEEQKKSTIPQMIDAFRAGTLPRRSLIKALTAMGVSAGGVGTIATVAASRAFSAKAAQASNKADEQVAQNIQLHKQHLARQSQGDASGMSNDYAHNAVVHDSMHEMPIMGREAIMQRKSITAIPDLQISVRKRMAEGSQVIVEWTATGTHNTHFPGLPATGRAFSFDGVTVVIRENGKIVHEAIYYDMTEVRKQLDLNA